MSTPTELWKNWEGRVVDEKFPLRQWLGGSDHSAVFLTERTGAAPQTAVIKLIRAESGSDSNSNSNDDTQLSRWASAAKLSHPHLIRLFECGRSAIDGTPLLYVVMEYAEENLAEILPLRAAFSGGSFEMLGPRLKSLAYLHRSGFAHGRIKPSNIMAVNNQLKISADGLARSGARQRARPAPTTRLSLRPAGVSPGADMWSLGITLVAVLTQNEPKLKIGIEDGLPCRRRFRSPSAKLRGSACRSIRQQRCTVANILSQLQSHAFQIKAPVGAKVGETRGPQLPMKRWIAVPIVVVGLFLIAWVGSRFRVHQPAIPAAKTRPASPPADTRATQSPAPFSENKKPAHKGVGRGSVLEQVLPEVSRSAQNTIRGHVKVSVQFRWTLPATSPRQNSSLPDRASTLRSGRWLRHANGNSLRRKWTDNRPPVSGSCAFSSHARTSTCFPSETKP